MTPLTLIAAESRPTSDQLAIAEVESSSALSWVEALVDAPGGQGVYTYSVPFHLTVQPGDILSVPFGAQQVGAIAVQRVFELPEGLDPAAVRPIEEIVSQHFFPATYWDLLQQVAEYYHTPLMSVIRVALPPGLLRRSQRRIRLVSTIPPEAQCHHPAAAHILSLLQAKQTQTKKGGDYAWQYLQRQVRQAAVGLRELLRQGWVESYLATPSPIRPKQQQVVMLTATLGIDLKPRQQEILDLLKRRGGEMGLQELLQACHISSATLKPLVQQGLLMIHSREVLRLDDTSSGQTDQPKTLTAAQSQALQAIQDIKAFQQILLHGVTGSGKTEVYLQAIAPLLQRGESALVLVPEIGLTPQLTDRFRARFGSQVYVYHSGLSDGERYDTWRQMLQGMPQVIIGTRSAVFAPLTNLGLIILDEEHDDSFKQDQPAPCYHARKVAQWRAALANCPLILGSATPSLETWHSIAPGLSEKPGSRESQIAEISLQPLPSQPGSSGAAGSRPSLYLSLPERIQARPIPPIEVVDMRLELRQGNRSVLSRSLQTALQTMQSKGEQGILFIHRRGHSTFVSCRSCGHVMECPHCDVSLTYHQPLSGGYESLHCHYCGYRQAHPPRCPACGSPYLKHFGSGTQRIVQELNRVLPELRCIRFDSDTTRAKGAHRALLNRFAAGEADLLVGTQMLTKGIDLPQVTLVGVVAADGLLYLSDYRASERSFQTLTQVAGRSGRGENPGRVILQTYSPQHPVIEALLGQDYATFAATELQQRVDLHYPPYGQLTLLRLSGHDPAIVQDTAENLAQFLRQIYSSERADRLSGEILGPSAAAIPRVARRYHWQILIKQWDGSTPVERQLPSLAELRTHCPAGINLTLDIDPLHLL
ncbi:MAG: primosomal protein N' [Elainella sp. Prado103]|nr:primosomal protein N' [Elainella sp. Prado103]